MRRHEGLEAPARGRRRGFGFNPRLIILVLFAIYGVYYYFSNQTLDPVTGETVLIDKSLSIEDEKALGLQAYEEILSQERPVDPNSEIARQIRDIVDLVQKVARLSATILNSG